MAKSKKISIQDFIKVFEGIDEQILTLHQCSSDDFLGLNSDFKQYYKQSKAISENATQIFNALAEEQTQALLKNLEKLYKDLKQIQIQFSGHLNSSIKLITEIGKLHGKLFLPVKNLNQDLLTLKFLLANLKISNSTNLNASEENLEQVLRRYNEVISEFKICSFQNEGNLETLKEAVSKSLTHFETISEKNIHDLDIILNNIHYGIILFADKHEEVSRQIPELTLKTKSSSSSIADIITNLQYHDIIRQKMEHVQATHKRLLNELIQIANEPEDELSEKHQRLLVRIRDIANLQSAQLVFANKEYQQAIEVITEKFLSISLDMTTIAAMCQTINISQDNSDELYLQNLLEKLRNSANVLNRFLEASSSFSEHIDGLTARIRSTSESISKFSTALQDLKQATGSTLSIFNADQTEDKELKQSLKQVETLYHDVERFEGIIRQVFNDIENIGGKLLPDIGQNLRGVQSDGLFMQAAKSMTSIINELNQKYLNIKSQLDENLKTSKTISTDVIDSINKIRYYDFFEKVIEDIIYEFNHIHQMLKSEIDADGEKTESLESLKKLYTMASEHKIHDKVTQTEGDVDLFSDDSTSEVKEDDDNLELF